MKRLFFALIALSLGTVAATAGNPESQKPRHAFALAGLSGSSCGCTTHVAPTCASAPTCQTSCASTSTPCCPRLIPLLLNKVDCAIQRLMYDPCNVPCARPRPARHVCCDCAWSSYSGKCGCDAGCATSWPTPSHNDPFQDDSLEVPPAPLKDAHHDPKVRARPVKLSLKSDDEVPALEPVPTEPLNTKVDNAPLAPNPPRVLTAAKHDRASHQRVPNNPLRK